MRRHSWKDSGVTVGSNVHGAHPDRSIERCAWCATERVPDLGAKTLYLYRGGRAEVNNKPVPPDRWSGYIVIPRCVER